MKTVKSWLLPNLLISLTLLLSACSETSTPTPPIEPIEGVLTPTTVTAEGSLLPEPSAELAFLQYGIIADVLVKPGQDVTEGDALARLVGFETIQAELAAAQMDQTVAQTADATLLRNALLTASQTEKALRDAQKAYDSAANGWNIVDGNNASGIELSIEDYMSAEEKFSDARNELIRQLVKDEGNVKRQDAQADYDREKKALEEAYNLLLQVVAGYNQPLSDKQIKILNAIGALESIRANQSRLDDNNLDAEAAAVTDARLAAANAHVAAAESAVALYEIHAPFSGTIQSIDLKVGEGVMPGIPVVYLADPKSWIVETKDLAEIDIARVMLGQKAIVLLDAFPGEEFEATVTAIDPVGKEYLGDMTYKVTVTLDETDDRFMWFMTATVSIIIED